MIALENAIPGSVKIRRMRDGAWHVTQRALLGAQDNNHNPAWLRVRNTGRPATVRLHLRWAEFRWMGYRKFAYLRRGTRWEAIQGATTPRETHYEFTAPTGESWFGSIPWYDNDAAARFIRTVLRRGKGLCRSQSIGTTGEGRDIPCLTITDPAVTARKQNVVLLARAHANETSGSFAFESIGRWLLEEAPRALLRRYAFQMIPIANPDGVAHGIKLTRIGPADRFDMERGGTTSDDPTIVAVREAVLRWKPAVLLDYHTYLFSPPFLYTYDRALALRMLRELLADAPPPQGALSWLTHVPAPDPGRDGLRGHCHRTFDTQVLITELPWYGGRLPSQIAAQGLQFFRAGLRATGLAGR